MLRCPAVLLRHLCCCLALVASVGFASVGSASAQSTGSQAPSSSAPVPVASHERTGEDIFRAGCITCHGADGQGARRELLGFADDVDIPNFTECKLTTPEPDSDWLAIIHEGGRTRGFTGKMPSFQDLLSDDEIDRLVRYLRGFCPDRAWPHGDLNFPRPLFTEKAFPENEALLTTTVDHGASAAVGDSFLYEHRIGKRAQWEMSVPVNIQKQSSASWGPGLGDVTVAFKRVLYDSQAQGRIVSAGSELLLPTGSPTRGFGKGVNIFEPFVVAGQALPHDAFIQAHVGMELPTNLQKAAKEAFIRTAVGKSFYSGRWGRSWTPMIEILGARELADGETTLWDFVPQMQITLSRRQHIMISGGMRFPVNERGERKSEVVSYFLWDWFDGGLFDGWK